MAGVPFQPSMLSKSSSPLSILNKRRVKHNPRRKRKEGASLGDYSSRGVLVPSLVRNISVIYLMNRQWILLLQTQQSSLNVNSNHTAPKNSGKISNH